MRQDGEEGHCPADVVVRSENVFAEGEQLQKMPFPHLIWATR